MYRRGHEIRKSHTASQSRLNSTLKDEDSSHLFSVLSYVLGTRDAYEKVSHPSSPIPHHLVKNIALVNTYKHVIERRMHFFPFFPFSCQFLLVYPCGLGEVRKERRGVKCGVLCSPGCCVTHLSHPGYHREREISMREGWHACPFFLLSE